MFSWIPRSLVAQELREQLAHLFRLLLLHPVPGSVQQMEAHHARARGAPHSVHGPRRLIDAPVALACHEHRRTIDGTAQDRMNLRNALGIRSGGKSITLKRSGDLRPVVLV